MIIEDQISSTNQRRPPKTANNKSTTQPKKIKLFLPPSYHTERRSGKWIQDQDSQNMISIEANTIQMQDSTGNFKAYNSNDSSSADPSVKPKHTILATKRGGKQPQPANGTPWDMLSWYLKPALSLKVPLLRIRPEQRGFGLGGKGSPSASNSPWSTKREKRSSGSKLAWQQVQVL